MILDCETCVARQTQACDGCIVSYLLDRPEGAVILDMAEERALRSLSAAGLAPESRYAPLPIVS